MFTVQTYEVIVLGFTTIQCASFTSGSYYSVADAYAISNGGGGGEAIASVKMQLYIVFKQYITVFSNIRDEPRPIQPSLHLLYKGSTASFGTNSMAFRRSILWNSTADVIKHNNTVSVFGKNVNNWTGEGFNCNICK